MFAQDSIDLLLRSGIVFKNHEEKGIDVAVFGELLMCVAGPAASQPTRRCEARRNARRETRLRARLH